ncbi:hypothetical protein ACTHRK_18940, partial [Dietzia cercidiphylli]|uniref:hypothetical protein n=1 Tax=Dietzia cercidiphylli TaxID=498199 RepID=UPI003F81BA6C
HAHRRNRTHRHPAEAFLTLHESAGLVAVTSTHKRTGVAIAGIGASLGGVLVAAIAFVVATGRSS